MCGSKSTVCNAINYIWSKCNIVDSKYVTNVRSNLPAFLHHRKEINFLIDTNVAILNIRDLLHQKDVKTVHLSQMN